MKRIFLIGLSVSLAACSTNETTGKQEIDYDKVRAATMLTCAVAPTAAQIAQLYTDNKNVRTTHDAVALMCSAALPIITRDMK